MIEHMTLGSIPIDEGEKIIEYSQYKQKKDIVFLLLLLFSRD